MSTVDEPPADLESGLLELYNGPLEGFIARRDALARQLKEGGDSDEAARVKKLRKPSRMAWALDSAFYADPGTVEQVAAAVKTMVEAQAGRGDMRDATRGLHDAVQAAAALAASTAKDAGAPVERAAVGPAILAVVADPAAFMDLRLGRLGDIPTGGGGLDALTDPPDLTVADLPRARLTVVPSPAPAEPRDEAEVKRARAAVADAQSVADAARAEAEAADQAVDEAARVADEAQQALRQAEIDVVAARERLRDAQRMAKQATNQARKAERELAKARGRLGDD